MNRYTFDCTRRAVVLGTCMAALSASASAATLTWGSSGAGGNGNWTDANAWYDGSAQATWSSATPDSGVFAGTAGTVSLTTTATAQNLQFAASGYTVQSGTLNIRGGVATDSGAATISSAISGTGFTKSGGGTLRISNTSSTFTGTTSVTAGTLVWTGTGRNSFARGKRAYDIAAGSTLKLDAGGTINFGSSVTGTTTLTGGGVFNVAAGTVFTSDNNNSGNVVMSLGPGAQIVVDGVMGASQLWLSSTYTRGLTFYADNKADLVINAGGRFNAQYSSALASPSLDIVVNSLLGSGTFDKGQLDPTNLKVGINNGSGTFAGTFINNTDRITFIKVGTGTQTLSGTGPGMTFNAQAGGLLINGTMGGGGLTTVSAGAVFGGTGELGGALTFSSGSSMFLFNAAAPLTVGGGVTFDEPATFGVANIAGLTNSVADGTYTLISGNVTTTGLANFGAANAYSLGGSKSAYFDEVPGSMFRLVVGPGGGSGITINVASGTQTQTQAGYATLSGAGPLLKTGGGTLVLDQANTLTGSTTVQSGRLQLANGLALGASRIVPLAGGTVTLSPALQTTVGGLAPNAGGLVDVGTGFVTVAAGLSAADMLVALGSGRGDGGWNGPSGITSSAAEASGGNRTVGWLDNGDGTVTFAFAAAGDTNLDWTVDILDASNFLAGGKFDTGAPAPWIDGDFTYDGLVDILDAASFLSTGLFDAGGYNTPPGQAGAVAAVPEPAGLTATALGALACLLLRGRRVGRSLAAVTQPTRSQGDGAMASCRLGRVFQGVILGGCLAALPASASAATLTWGSAGAGGTGNWTAANAWYDGAAPATWNSATPDSGVFAGTAGTVTVSTATAATMQFSTTGYTVQSGTLNIRGGVTVDTGTATVSSAISGTGFTKSGGGVLRISNSNSTFTGTTSIAVGTLAWTGTGRTSFARGLRTYDIAAGSTLKLDGGGTINFGSSATGTTTLTGGGVFNVAAGTVFTSDGSTSGNVVMALGSGGQIVVDGVLGTSQTWISGSLTNRGYTYFTDNKADLVINAGARVNVQASSALATPTQDVIVNALLGSGTLDKSIAAPTTLKVGIDNGSGTFAGSFIANSGGNQMHLLTLTKVGTGTQTLSGTAAPGLSFNVQAGGLLIDGTMFSTTGTSGLTTVSPGGVFGGTGVLGGSLTFASGSSLFLFNPTAPLTVGGTGGVTFANPATFGVANIAGLTSSVADGTYTLISGSVATTGLANFGPANAYDLGGGKAAYFDAVPGSMFQLIVVPEPSAAFVVGLAIAAIARFSRRAADGGSSPGE